MELVQYGVLQAASDQTMAQTARTVGTSFRGAVDEVMATFTNTQTSDFRGALNNLLSAIASGIISNDPTIINAANAAIAVAIQNQDVVTSGYTTGRVVELQDGSGVTLAWLRDLDSSPYIDGKGDGINRMSGGGGGGGSTGFTSTALIPVLGQSNAVGVLGSPIAVGSADPLPNLFMVPQRGAGAGSVVAASEPLAHPYNAAQSDTRGFAFAFARWYAVQHPDVRVVLVPCAVSGSGFRYSATSSQTWAPGREGESGTTNLYREAINRVKAAEKLFSGPVRTPVILWHQGEADAVGNTTQSRYSADLDALIAGCRSQMPEASDAIFLVGQTTWEFRNVRRPGSYAQISAATIATPSRVKRTGFANAPGQGFCNPDDTHFTGEGQWLLAQNYIGAYNDALYNRA